MTLKQISLAALAGTCIVGGATVASAESNISGESSSLMSSRALQRELPRHNDVFGSPNYRGWNAYGSARVIERPVRKPVRVQRVQPGWR